MKLRRFGTILLTICITIIVICIAIVVLGRMYLENRQTGESQQLEASTAELMTEAETEAEVETEAEEETEAETEAEEETETPTEAPTEAETEAPQEFEEAVVPESGDAYLCVVDGQWWLEYFGNDNDYLSYAAGVVPITGNGDYTVSVTCDTNSIRYDTTGDPNGELVAGGISFMTVQILDGADVCPDAIITISSVVVDGAEIALTKKSCTYTEIAEVDGADHNNICSDIYNPWISDGSLPDDARSEEGTLTNLEDSSEYSAVIIDSSEIGEWTTIEVNFTISGM